jgi:general transcription factor 3C protein 4
MRLSVADLCWVSVLYRYAYNVMTLGILQKLSLSESQAQVECGQVAQYLLTTIAHWVLRIIVRHLLAIMSVITSQSIVSNQSE